MLNKADISVTKEAFLFKWILFQTHPFDYYGIWEGDEKSMDVAPGHSVRQVFRLRDLVPGAEYSLGKWRHFPTRFLALFLRAGARLKGTGKTYYNGVNFKTACRIIEAVKRDSDNRKVIQ